MAGADRCVFARIALMCLRISCQLYLIIRPSGASRIRENRTFTFDKATEFRLSSDKLNPWN